MQNRIITHKNSQQSTHLYIELSPSLTKTSTDKTQPPKTSLTEKNGHDKKDIIKKINKHIKSRQ